jgi:hypothetical protein
MNDQIVCPYCKKQIPLTDALSHQIQEKYKVFYKKRLSEETEKIRIEEKNKIKMQLQKEVELQLKDKGNEIEELRKQNKNLQEQFLELNKLIRQLRKENDERRIEMEKQFAQEQEKIRLEEKKKINEEYHLKLLEKEKKLTDALKMNEELKQKLEQGSQQTQGEVLELDLEQRLKQEFPADDIQPVAKGIRGGDIIQTVKNQFIKPCGTILWELKRTKSWSPQWISKLKEDQRNIKADVAVILSRVLPEEIKNFGLIQGVWIGNFESIIGLSTVLRGTLINIAAVKQSAVGKAEKKEILWNYLTSIEFQQRLEAIHEAYEQLQKDLHTEKKWFMNKWAKQDKTMHSIIENMLGMHGDLQSIMGKALSEIKGLELLPEGK